jgi:hypothetical protein
MRNASKGSAQQKQRRRIWRNRPSVAGTVKYLAAPVGGGHTRSSYERNRAERSKARKLRDDQKSK